MTAKTTDWTEDWKSVPCRIFHGSKAPSRYGQQGYGILNLKKDSHQAHRVAYQLLVGPIPLGSRLLVCHRCDNPPCIEPKHLFLGTVLDNMMDCVEKGRHCHTRQTHCKRGHEFNDTNTLVINKNGRKWRECRLCRRAHQARYYREKARALPPSGEAKP